MNSIKRHFLSQLSLAAAGTAISGKMNASSFLIYKPSIVEEFVETETTYGKIKGYRTAGVNLFNGIPYAGKTAGER